MGSIKRNKMSSTSPPKRQRLSQKAAQHARKKS